MSHGTPPRNTFEEYTGFLYMRGGNCPLHVQVASQIAVEIKPVKGSWRMVQQALDKAAE